MKLVHLNVDEEGNRVWLHGIHKILPLAMREVIPTNAEYKLIRRRSRSHNKHINDETFLIRSQFLI
jgi:hypothetical protein